MEEKLFETIKLEGDIIVPLNILNDYVNQFNDAFKSKIYIEVKNNWEDPISSFPELIFSESDTRESQEKTFVIRGYIVVPGLSNYRLLFIKLSYKVSKLYPCKIFKVLSDDPNLAYECQSAEEVKTVLRLYFSSSDFLNPIKNILSQLQ